MSHLENLAVGTVIKIDLQCQLSHWQQDPSSGGMISRNLIWHARKILMLGGSSNTKRTALIKVHPAPLLDLEHKKYAFNQQP